MTHLVYHKTKMDERLIPRWLIVELKHIYSIIHLSRTCMITPRFMWQCYFSPLSTPVLFFCGIFIGSFRHLRPVYDFSVVPPRMDIVPTVLTCVYVHVVGINSFASLVSRQGTVGMSLVILGVDMSGTTKQISLFRRRWLSIALAWSNANDEETTQIFKKKTG